MPTQDEAQNIFKIELTAEAPPWHPSIPEFSRQEQSMFDQGDGLPALTLQ